MINPSIYKIKDQSKVNSPLLLLYPELVQKNIDLIISYIRNVNNLRPHVKTIKSKPIIKQLIESGIKKFKCATIQEAKLLGDLKVKDVLIAYPIVGFQIDEFIAIIKEYPNTIFQCTVDSTDAAYFIDAKAKEYNLKISVFIDVDLGMGRTGVKINCVNDLYEELNDFSNIKVVGFHG